MDHSPPPGHAVTHVGADYTDEELAWLKAVDEYRRRTGRRFLTCREWLAIATSLGYRRVAEPTPLPAGKLPPGVE